MLQFARFLFPHVHNHNSDVSASSEYLISTGDSLISLGKDAVHPIYLLRRVGIILKLRTSAPLPSYMSICSIDVPPLSTPVGRLCSFFETLKHSLVHST